MIVDLMHSFECKEQGEQDPEAQRNWGEYPLAD